MLAQSRRDMEVERQLHEREFERSWKRKDIIGLSIGSMHEREFGIGSVTGECLLGISIGSLRDHGSG